MIAAVETRLVRLVVALVENDDGWQHEIDRGVLITELDSYIY